MFQPRSRYTRSRLDIGYHLPVDEYSEGVQPSIVEEISENPRAINDELGTTILFVEQNLGVIQEMANRRYAMKRGRLVDELSHETLQREDDIARYLPVDHRDADPRSASTTRGDSQCVVMRFWRGSDR